MEINVQNNDYRDSENKTTQNFEGAHIENQENNYIFKLNVLKKYDIKKEYKKWLFSFFVKFISFAFILSIGLAVFLQFAKVKTYTRFEYQVLLMLSCMAIIIILSEILFNKIFKKNNEK